MKTKHSYSIILTFIFTIIITGCTAPGGAGVSSGTTAGENYHSGYNGITMNFINGNPPQELYAISSGGAAVTDNFALMLEIKNEGAYDINNYHFTLSGYDQSIFDVRDNWKKTNLDGGDNRLEGKSVDNPVGDYGTITWNINNARLAEGTDSFDQTFSVAACYDYRTEASIAVCVDPQPWKTGIRDDVCNPGDVSVSGGQGAPVAVTNVEVIPMNNKVQMKVEIQNAGNGEVVERYDRNNCPHNLDYQDLNKVHVTTTLGQSGSPTSGPNPNPVLLVNGRGFFYVTFQANDVSGRGNAFLSTLNVKLDYAYTQSIQKHLTVKTIPG